MYVLGIDCAQDFVSVALREDERLVGEISYRAPMRQLRYLTHMITELAARCEVPLAKLGLLGFTAGPGSFTGLRLGLVTAKTLAQVLDIPLAGLDTLDVIAAGCAHAAGTLVVACDARRREVFSKVYRVRGGVAEIVRPLAAGSAEALAREMERIDGETLLLTGNALERYGDILLGAGRKALPLGEDLRHPRASVVARLARERHLEGMSVDFLTVEAQYFRPPDIQVDARMKA